MGEQNELGRMFAIGKGSRQRSIAASSAIRAFEASKASAMRLQLSLCLRPGPAMTASTSAACSAICRRGQGERAVAFLGQSHHHRLRHRHADCVAMLAPVAMLSLPAPARIAAVAVSNAAPGTSRLPAMTSSRPLVSLSPSTTGGSGCAPSAARSSLTAFPPLRPAPRSWAHPPPRAARRDSTG